MQTLRSQTTNSARQVPPIKSEVRVVLVDAESLSWQGRFQEALAEGEQARRLDPLSPIIGVDYASILYYSHQYEGALKQIRSVLELGPNFEHTQGEMVPFYFANGHI